MTAVVDKGADAPVTADGARSLRPLRYVPALDGLRCLAALFIILGHAGSKFPASPRLLAQGGSVVLTFLQVFFITSGFLIYRPLVQRILAPDAVEPKSGRSAPSFWVFIARRMLRIFPLYWAALAVKCAIYGAGDVSGVTDWLQLIFLFPLPDPGVIVRGGLGIAMWTLAVELPFYILMPLFAMATRAIARGPLRVWSAFQVQLVCIIGVMTAIVVLALVIDAPIILPLLSLPVGTLLATLEVEQWHRGRRFRSLAWLADRWWLCLAIFVAIWQSAAYIGLSSGVIETLDDIFKEQRFVQYPLQVSAAVMLFIPLTYGRRSLLSWFVATPPFLLIAPLTYGTYLWHPIVLQQLADRMGRGLWVLTVGTVVISLSLSVLSRYAIEYPAGLLREWIDRRSERGRRTSAAVAPAPSGGGKVAAQVVPTTPWCEPLDGFRAICACLAVAGHTFLASAIFPFSGALHVLGILVALFFAISAYVLYQPFIEADARGLERPKATSFYVRRLLRIYPLFAMALTMYLVALPEVRPDNAWGYVRLYLFLQIFGEELSGLKGLPSAWYLCNEVIFYFMMPVMAVAAARWSNRRSLRRPADRLRAHLAIGWGMVLLGPLTRTLLYDFDAPAPTSLPFSHLEFFGFGVVVAVYAVGMRNGIRPPSLIAWLARHTGVAYAMVLVPVFMLAGIAARWGDGTGLWADAGIEDRLRFFPYLIAIFLLMTAAGLGSAGSTANRFLSATSFKSLSGLALHIYLWHQLVLGIMNIQFGGLDKADLGSRFVTGAGLVIVALAGSILIARMSQPLTDRPYEQYRVRHGRSRGRGSAPAPRGRRPVVAASSAT